MKLELGIGAVVLLGAVGWRVAAEPPLVQAELWQAITYPGCALLGIGLVRDLWIKLVKRPVREARRSGEKLICLESLVGALLVASGLGLLGLGVMHELDLRASTIGMALGVTFLVSGAIADVVVVFKRDKDHLNLIPW